MRQDLAVRRQQELISRVREIYSESYSFSRTFDAHLSRMATSVWQSEDYKRCPTWVRQSVHTAEQILFHSLYEWRYGNKAPLASVSIGPDGRLFGERDDTWLREDSDYKSKMQCIHVWRHKWDAGELKVWS